MSSKSFKSFVLEDAEEIDEVLSQSDPASKWIHDFVKSDNPKFKGKTKKERIKMALGAYYAKQRNEEVESIDEISQQTKASYTAKAKAQVKELKPFTQKKSEYHDLAKNLIAKRTAGIAKANEELQDVAETTGVTNYNPPSQGGTRKELLAKYHKTKNAKDAEAARKAGATQKELQGVAEGRVDQLPTKGADYSDYDTEHLRTLLKPGILHRNEARFKALIRKELKKREQQSQQGVAEGLNEMDKSQTPPGRDGGHQFPEPKVSKKDRDAVKKDPAKHLSDLFAKYDKKKKGVAKEVIESSARSRISRMMQDKAMVKNPPKIPSHAERRAELETKEKESKKAE